MFLAKHTHVQPTYFLADGTTAYTAAEPIDVSLETAVKIVNTMVLPFRDEIVRVHFALMAKKAGSWTQVGKADFAVKPNRKIAEWLVS